MLRLTMLLLCFMLAAAAAGRYKAEAAVRESRAELTALDRNKSRALTEIQLLRAEVAFLESPDRLARIASNMTDLEPLSGAQLLTAEEFQTAFGAIKSEPPAETAPASGVVAIAQLGFIPAR